MLAYRMRTIYARGNFMPERLSSSSSLHRCLSSTQAVDTEPTVKENKMQVFVKGPIQPGEWDPQRRSPLYRPQWKRADVKIVSAEDFRNRPKVGLNGEFQSFQDAMITLSWQDQATQKAIYQVYLAMLADQHERHDGTTSHEYIVRILAQKYNITAERVAATIRLQHNEQQLMREDPDRDFLTDVADYMDDQIQKEIQQAYKANNMKPPGSGFIEDPVAVSGIGPRKAYQVIDDLVDAEERLNNASERERHEARVKIDEHVYIEDKDVNTVDIPLSKDCRALLKKTMPPVRYTASVPPQPEPTSHPRRPRWKYVAQVVNTRVLKEKKRRHKSYTNHSPRDTLVNEGTALRAAKLGDVQKTSWKPKRHVLEFMYAGAKQGWLEKTLHGHVDAWGEAPSLEELRAASAKKSVKQRDPDDDNSSDEDSDESVPSSGSESSDDESPDDHFEDAGKTEEEISPKET